MSVRAVVILNVVFVLFRVAQIPYELFLFLKMFKDGVFVFLSLVFCLNSCLLAHCSMTYSDVKLPQEAK